jgi:ankyrin repeat protein
MSAENDQQLLAAAGSGDLEGVKAALADGADLKARDVIDFDALSLAVRDGHLEVVEYLLAQGIEVTSLSLQAASMSVYSSPYLLGLLQLAQLKQVKPEFNQQTDAGRQLLQSAYNGDTAALQQAIQSGADVNIADEQDNAALRWAARRGHLEAARILLDSGADVNQKSRSGWTALLEAIIAGSLPLVKLLIERGADINARIQNGGSIRYFARDILIYASDKQAATQIYDHIVSLGAEYHSPDVDQD